MLEKAWEHLLEKPRTELYLFHKLDAWLLGTILWISFPLFEYGANDSHSLKLRRENRVCRVPDFRGALRKGRLRRLYFDRKGDQQGDL